MDDRRKDAAQCSLFFSSLAVFNHRSSFRPHIIGFMGGGGALRRSREVVVLHGTFTSVGLIID